MPDGTGSEITAQAATSTTTSNTSTFTASQGTITALKSAGNFSVSDSTTHASVLVTYPAMSYLNTSGAALGVGHYALAVGTLSGSTLSASYVAVLPSAPSSVSVAGTFLGTVRYGIEVRATQTGSVVPVMISRSTSMGALPAVGSPITVNGTGSVHAAILATSISGSSSSTATAPPAATPDAVVPQTATAGVPKHVLTADYLGAPFGTTSISGSRAAPYLSWANTGVENTNAFHDAGIKTELYVSPDRTQSNDPLYHTAGAAGFSRTCSSSPVTTKYGSITQYIMNPGASAFHSAYSSYISSVISGYHVDALFEDDAAQLGHYAPSVFSPGLPCGYSDAKWISEEKSLEASAPIPTILNGMNTVTSSGVSMLSQVVVGNAKTIGGNFESCFSQSTAPAVGSWVWTQTEQTQLDLVRSGKNFQCMGLNAGAASAETAARAYTLASFELTYNPSHSILWTMFKTPSGMHVLPETGFVALNPIVAEPSSVASLRSSTGAYVREYNDCYYHGSLVGACAMVVNPDSASHASPHFSHAFHHTLSMSGYGVLDGGTVSFAGAAPPSVVGGLRAYIALP